MFQLIRDATAMLLDRQEQERALINYIAAMPDEERHAIVLAYRLINDDESDE